MDAEAAAQLVQQIQFLTNQVNELQQQQQQHPPASRIKPRKPNDFTGVSKELSGWIYAFQLYCHSTGITSDVEKIQHAVQYLQGAAKTWVQAVYPEGSLGAVPWSTWSQFCDALRSSFGPQQEHLQARERLDNLRQRRNQSVLDYIQEYREIKLQLPELTQDELVHRFRKTLYWDKVKEYITQSTANKDRTTLQFEDVANLAALGELELIPASQRNKNGYNAAQHWQSRQPTPAPGPRPVAMDIGNIGSRPSGSMDRDALRREGRCFYCKERGHRKADCPELTKQGNGRRRQ